MMMGRRIMRVFGETLLVAVCFLHLCIGQFETCKPAECFSNASQISFNGIGQFETCKPAECFSNASQISFNGVPQNCTIKDFNVTVKNETFLPAAEGSDVSVRCVHDVPNASICWKKDDQLQEQKSDIFQIKNILRGTVIECRVKSLCGVFNSSIPISVTAANNMVIILVCVGAAAALLMMFAIGMKISLRRGQVQSQARKRQRQQHMENIHSTTMNTVTTYD